MLVFRRLCGKMVAEAFHCTDYESEHVADTAIFPNLTVQSADEKVIIMHSNNAYITKSMVDSKMS